MKIGKTFYARNRKEWRRWLRANHQTAREIWLIYYKKASGKPRVAYNDAVDEALCFGWIDSILKPIDEHKYAQRYSPRRKTSKLSDMNRERVRRLTKAGLMTKAGLDAIAHTGKGPTALPADILKRLQADPLAWKYFQKFPASYKRIRVGWIHAARHRRTAFEQRLRYFVKMTARNQRFGMVQ